MPTRGSLLPPPMNSRLSRPNCYSLLVCFFLGLFSGFADALTINVRYVAEGNPLGTFGTAGTAPGNTAGGGSLRRLVEAEADYWESVYSDSHVVTLDYGWFPRDSGATHRLVSEGGTPHREWEGTIAFDNDGSTIWFLDPTPWDHGEFGPLTNYSADLGGGTMNIGRQYSGGAGAAANFDLFSTAIHEIGHALGLSNANNAYGAEAADQVINVSQPLPWVGAAIPLDDGGAHLDLANALLRPSRPYGVRRLASHADILANAQISRFQQINFDPVVAQRPPLRLVNIRFTGRRSDGRMRISGTIAGGKPGEQVLLEASNDLGRTNYWEGIWIAFLNSEGQVSFEDLVDHRSSAISAPAGFVRARRVE